MRHKSLQQAARGAFSEEDWLLLASDAQLLRSFANLATTEAVEEFVFDAYDRLRSLREETIAKGQSSLPISIFSRTTPEPA